MLHEAALSGNQEAGLFLIKHGANLNMCNLQVIKKALIFQMSGFFMIQIQYFNGLNE